jgi:hypothetical protein
MERSMLACGPYPRVEPTNQDPSHGIHPGIPCQDMERVDAYLDLDYTW